MQCREIVYQRPEVKSLWKYVNKQREAGMFNDVTICAGKITIPANRMVLSCYSNFFKALFTEKVTEEKESIVTITEVEGNSVKSLIEFIYTGSIKINRENVYHLLSASNFLQIEIAQEFCFQFLIKTCNGGNCFPLIKLADRIKSENFKNKLKEFIGENIEEVVNGKDFKQFSKTEVIDYISSQSLEKVQESSKYKAYVRWTKGDLASRRSVFCELLRFMDFEEIENDFLVDVILKEELISDCLICCRLLLKVLAERVKGPQDKDRSTHIISVSGWATRSDVISIFSIRKRERHRRSYPKLPVEMLNTRAVKIGQVVYVLGGEDANNFTTNVCYQLNLNRDVLKWIQIPPMNHDRCLMGATSLNGKLYVAGGFDETNEREFSSCEFLEPGAASWELLPSMTQDRCHNQLVACNGRLYAIGGCNDEGGLATVECFQPGSEAWEHVAPMKTSRFSFGAVSLDGAIYVFGGCSDENETLKSGEKYDPVANSWSSICPMNEKRSKFSSCVLRKKIYATGGHCEATIDCYDPFVDKWTIVGKTDLELVCHSTFVV